MKKIILLAFCCVLLASSAVFGQAQQNDDSDLGKVLGALAGDAALGYLGPAGSGFGNDLNSGWFHRAPSAKIFGFDFEFGVVASGTILPDTKKTFEVSSTFRFNNTQAGFIANGLTNDPNYNALSVAQKSQVRTSLINQIMANAIGVSFAGPTFTGPKDIPLVVKTSGGAFTLLSPVPGVPNSTFNLPVYQDTIKDGNGKPIGGFDIPIVPLILPQISIGTLFGTQFTLRGAPVEIPAGSFGKVKFFGFGIQHNPGIWFPNPLPVDIAFGYFSTDLKVGTILETKATAFGLNVSKRFGPGMLNITPYAGLMLESSNTTVTYTFTQNSQAGPVTVPINFEFPGENKSRITFGLSLTLLFFNINADYNIGTLHSVSAGLMFVI